MNEEEAGVRYLDIVCPSNQRKDEIVEDRRKLLELYDQGKLSKKTMLSKYDEKELAYAKIDERLTKELTDTQYEWPSTVRQLTVELAAANLEIVSAMREFLREGGFTKTVTEENKWPDPYPFTEEIKKTGEKASAVRSALRLPARNEGCKAGKRDLTLEQIKKLQST